MTLGKLAERVLATSNMLTDPAQCSASLRERFSIAALLASNKMSDLPAGVETRKATLPARLCQYARIGGYGDSQPPIPTSLMEPFEITAGVYSAWTSGTLVVFSKGRSDIFGVLGPLRSLQNFSCQNSVRHPAFARKLLIAVCLGTSVRP